MADHANRGVGWERVLEGWHDRYRREGRAVVFRTPPSVRLLSRVHRTTKQFRAVFAGEGPPDYTGAIAGGRPVVFDAKDCAGRRWSFGQLERHQARDLEAWHLAGGVAFVALQLGRAGWVLPWGELGPRWWGWHESSDRAAAGTASAGRDDLEAWAWRMPVPGDWLGALR